MMPLQNLSKYQFRKYNTYRTARRSQCQRVQLSWSNKPRQHPHPSLLFPHPSLESPTTDVQPLNTKFNLGECRSVPSPQRERETDTSPARASGHCTSHNNCPVRWILVTKHYWFSARLARCPPAAGLPPRPQPLTGGIIILFRGSHHPAAAGSPVSKLCWMLQNYLCAGNIYVQATKFQKT